MQLNSKPPSPYNTQSESDYDEKVSVESAERTYTAPSSNYIDTDAKSESHQIEVTPAKTNGELSYNDKDLEEGFDFEIQQKPTKKIIAETTSTSAGSGTGMTMKSVTMIRTTIPPSTTSLSASTTTTIFPTLITTTSGAPDLYDDDNKLPEIDEYYPNSSNKTKINKIFKSDVSFLFY
uniref:Uncharacterized protein n=1 Tax=Panagrolaimus davidi TaxID=227884 RepID=A0A914PY05_9BILA